MGRATVYGLFTYDLDLVFKGTEIKAVINTGAVASMMKLEVWDWKVEN